MQHLHQYKIRKYDPWKDAAGFTLMEIVVATSLFAISVSLMLGLFTYTLKINRTVQNQRKIAQGARNFTDMLVREIRNGRVDYYSPDSNCSSDNYGSSKNQAVGIITEDYERLCFYYSEGDQSIYESIATPNGPLVEKVNPEGFVVPNNSFRIAVRPVKDPNPEGGPPYSGIQPSVSIYALFKIEGINVGETTQIPYQTTISSDVYDIPHQQ